MTDQQAFLDNYDLHGQDPGYDLAAELAARFPVVRETAVGPIYALGPFNEDEPDSPTRYAFCAAGRLATGINLDRFAATAPKRVETFRRLGFAADSTGTVVASRRGELTEYKLEP